MISKNTQIAEKIFNLATKLNWKISIRGDILTISKHFTPGDNAGFIECDGEYWDILSLLPMTNPGSTWGADGGGIGGYSALKSGHFQMHKSGGSIRVLNALKKMVQ